MASSPEEAFRRYDETPDEEFYRVPWLVTHIDARAIAAVRQLYRELLPPGGEILDLMERPRPTFGSGEDWNPFAILGP